MWVGTNKCIKTANNLINFYNGHIIMVIAVNLGCCSCMCNSEPIYVYKYIMLFAMIELQTKDRFKKK